MQINSFFFTFFNIICSATVNVWVKRRRRRGWKECQQFPMLWGNDKVVMRLIAFCFFSFVSKSMSVLLMFLLFFSLSHFSHLLTSIWLLLFTLLRVMEFFMHDFHYNAMKMNEWKKKNSQGIKFFIAPNEKTIQLKP